MLFGKSTEFDVVTVLQSKQIIKIFMETIYFS